MSSDPFEVFIAEQGKRETEWSSIRAAKKQKVDDRRTSSKDGQQEELAVNVEELKRWLDEKNTECATLKGQLAELQRASVELLSKNQENVCKVSTRVLAFSTVKVTAPFNNTRTLKFKAETDNYVFCYHQSIVWGLRMLLKGAINKFWETRVAIHLHALTITSYNTMISVKNAHDKIFISVQ